jgi:PAS domain S-box-containing protein
MNNTNLPSAPLARNSPTIVPADFSVKSQRLAARDYAALRATEIRYRRLFEAAPDGILMVDPDTRRITDANPFMTELLCYPQTELIGKELWEIGLLGDKKANRTAFRNLQQNSFIRYENLPLRNKKGQRREVEFVSNLYDEDGRKVIQCNIRDITARKADERALLVAKNAIGRHAIELERVVAKRTAELRETIRELESFSYSLSHDMRAPLRAMQGFATFVMEEYGQQLDQKGIHYLEQIIRAAVRLDHLIKDVLSYTKILHEKAPMTSVDLNRLVRDIIGTLPNGPPITTPSIQIKGVLPKVQANEVLLAQCVSNLLSNAVKFVRPGVAAQVEISATASGSGRIRLWFKDNGIGIACADHRRIFRLFERVHPGAEYEGTGIGLTIVQKAVERMAATLGFRSRLGKGSQFWIQLTKA